MTGSRASARAPGRGSDGAYRLECDGAASGNPGPAGIGICLLGPSGESVEEVAEPIGTATNNVAEYSALLRGLEVARAHGARRVAIRMDSELVVKQVLGEYKVRQPHLAELFTRARSGLARFEAWTIEAVRRGQNARADALAKAGAERSRADGKE